MAADDARHQDTPTRFILKASDCDTDFYAWMQAQALRAQE